MPSKNSFPNFNRIDENLREIIESEARPGERYDDTILRLLREKKDRIEKLDHLNQELSQEIERYSRGQKDGK
jgi:transposase